MILFRYFVHQTVNNDLFLNMLFSRIIPLSYPDGAAPFSLGYLKWAWD
jgi:hypothetical protein